MAQYGIAHELRGFGSSDLRVRIVRVIPNADGKGNDDLNVITADLLDAGTPLALSAAQVEPMDDTVVDTVWQHSTGLVSFRA